MSRKLPEAIKKHFQLACVLTYATESCVRYDFTLNLVGFKQYNILLNTRT